MITVDQYKARMTRLQEDLWWEKDMLDWEAENLRFYERLLDRGNLTDTGRELCGQLILMVQESIKDYELRTSALRKRRDDLAEEFRTQNLLNPEPLL